MREMAHQPKGDTERLAALIEAKLADLESRTRAGDLPAHRSSENEAACLLDAYLDTQRERAEEAARGGRSDANWRTDWGAIRELRLKDAYLTELSRRACRS